MTVSRRKVRAPHVSSYSAITQEICFLDNYWEFSWITHMQACKKPIVRISWMFGICMLNIQREDHKPNNYKFKFRVKSNTTFLINYYTIKKRQSLLWPGDFQWRIYYHRMWSQLSTILAVTYCVAQWGTPSCSRPQPATYDGVRDGRSNWLVEPPTLMASTPWAPRIARCKRGRQIARLAAATGALKRVYGYARPTHCLCGHPGNKLYKLLPRKLLARAKVILQCMSSYFIKLVFYIHECCFWK